MSLEGRLPPGQVLTEKWPVLTHGSTPQVDRGAWRFKCVTRWSRLDNHWRGEPWKEERFGGG